MSKGSFRGVPFGAFGHSVESGRRTVTHEFPFRDEPYTEDLGRRARTFSLDLFALGDDAQIQRDRLQKALDKRGPGQLVHPYLGTLRVQVTSYTISESPDAQRLVTFSVVFVEVGAATQPTANQASAAAVASLVAEATVTAASAAGAMDLSSSQAVAALSLTTEELVATVTQAGKAAAKPQSLATADLRSQAIEEISGYERDARSLIDLVSTPDLLCNQLADVVFRLRRLGTTPLQALNAYRRLLVDVQVVFSALSYPETAIGIILAANAALLRDSAVTSIAGAAANQLLSAEFDSYDQALEAKTALSDLFDEALAEVQDVELFAALTDIKVRAIAQIPGDLPRLVRVPMATQLPTLVAAYHLMSGSTSEAKLIELNGVRNPWFAPESLLILR